MMKMESACRCETGKVRLNNEDNFYFDGRVLPVQNSGTGETLTLRKTLSQPFCSAVFDGMGGEQHGEQAAYIAAETLREHMAKPASSPETFLAGVCNTANERVCALSAEHGGDRMGATAAILYFTENNVWLCNIGDSRIYRLRAGEFEQLSVDHTDREFLEKQGVRGRKPALSQHLGIWPDEMVIEPYIVRHELRNGDRYLICSDGLSDMLTGGEIAAAISGAADVRAGIDGLLQRAMEAGGRDNVTVILCAAGK